MPLPNPTFVSATEGAVWPALPTADGAALLALLFQLERSQWWPADEIRRHQAAQLAALLAHARRQVPFYRHRLGAAAEAGDAAAMLAAWPELPILARAEVQEAGTALHSQALPPSHGGTDEIHTSGSTGRPVRVRRSRLWGLYWRAFTVRDHLWHRRDLGGTLAGIRESGKGKAPYPEGSRAESWGPASGSVFATGPMVSLNITTPLAQQVEWLQRRNPDYLLTHPSMAQRLAEHCLAHGIRLPRLRQVETISEILRPAVREACREAWGVPVVDLYTTREVGYIALQCPEREDAYHVQSEGVFVEVVDESGRPCGPGEMGRLLVTPLHNFAMPLIRYEIGDHVELGDGPCPCGRGLPVIRRILGRRQNMLVLPSGEERWPLLSSDDLKALTALAPIRQHQIVQTAPDGLELRLSTPRDLTEEEAAGLARWVREKFGYPFAVAVLAGREELPRSAAGKFEDFVCRVAR